MKEFFLHYIWRTGQFDSTFLQTADEKPIEIINPGFHNKDSGPDFFNAQIAIDGQPWVGNVEIHVCASDWLKHAHDLDSAYDNVVLHVVYENDAEVKTNSGLRMPTLELKTRIDDAVLERFENFCSEKNILPCASQLHKISALEKTEWLSRLVVERLERKVKLIENELENCGNDWEEVFYRNIARQFGMKVNAEPFQWLAISSPYRILSRQRDNLLQTEAILFGQSGLLEANAADDYSRALLREYKHLQIKYSLLPIESSSWKFMRLRPVNFPTIRIAQLAGLIFRQSRLFSECVESENVAAVKALLGVSASGYWDTHYRFGKTSARKPKQLGTQAVDTILINTVAPFRFLYGKRKNDCRLRDSAMDLLEDLGAETNSVTGGWDELGIRAVNASESQALLELSGNYCEGRKCLMCQWGEKLVVGG